MNSTWWMPALLLNALQDGALRWEGWKQTRAASKKHPSLKFSGPGLLLIKTMQKLSLQHKAKCNSALLSQSGSFFLLSLTLEGNLQVLPWTSWARAAESSQLGNSAVSSCKYFVCFLCKGSLQALVLWSFLPINHFIPLPQYGHQIDFFLS